MLLVCLVKLSQLEQTMITYNDNAPALLFGNYNMQRVMEMKNIVTTWFWAIKWWRDISKAWFLKDHSHREQFDQRQSICHITLYPYKPQVGAQKWMLAQFYHGAPQQYRAPSAHITLQLDSHSQNHTSEETTQFRDRSLLSSAFCQSHLYNSSRFFPHFHKPGRKPHILDVFQKNLYSRWTKET